MSQQFAPTAEVKSLLLQISLSLNLWLVASRVELCGAYLPFQVVMSLKVMRSRFYEVPDSRFQKLAYS